MVSTHLPSSQNSIWKFSPGVLRLGMEKEKVILGARVMRRSLMLLAVKL